MGPAGGGWITGLPDLVMAMGTSLFPTDLLWDMGVEATMGQDEVGRRRSSAGSSSGMSWGGVGYDNVEEDDMDDQGFSAGGGPRLREDLRTYELRGWEVRKRRLAAMKDCSTFEVSSGHIELESSASPVTSSSLVRTRPSGDRDRLAPGE